MKKTLGWTGIILSLAFTMAMTTETLFAEETGKEATDRLKTLEERMTAVEKGASSISINGFVDTYYSYNFNKPDSNLNTFSNFDFRHNAFGINLAEIVFSKTTSDSAPVGFRVDLDYGETTDFIHCGAFSCGGTGSPEEPFKNIQQAYVTWATPFKVTFDMGKFVTHMGAEVIESKDNWNYTRSLLFCCAIPYYHTGLRANVAISDSLFVNGYVLNGWNDVIETNKSKTFGATIGFTPIKKLPIVFNWIGPEEGPTGTSTFKNKQVYDLIVTLAATDKLTFMVNGDYGTLDPVPSGKSLKYSGVAAYARFAVDPCALAVRYEYTNDKDNVMYGTGLAPKVQEVTVTGEHKVSGNLLLRLEYRHDMSDKEIFTKEEGVLKKNQDRVVAGVVYSF